jgi:acyl carrier protein
MTLLPTDEQVFEVVTTAIVEALLVKAEEVTWESRLFIDLGAESLDIVDIRFRVEEAYQMKIDQDDLIKSLGENLTDREVGERFTVKALVTYIQRKLEAAEKS